MGLKRYLLGRYLKGQADKARKGKMGEKAKKVYWWLVGKKTYFGVALAFVSGGLAAIGQTEAAEKLGWFAGVLVNVGLLDKAWRATPPTPPAK